MKACVGNPSPIVAQKTSTLRTGPNISGLQSRGPWRSSLEVDPVCCINSAGRESDAAEFAHHYIDMMNAGAHECGEDVGTVSELSFTSWRLANSWCRSSNLTTWGECDASNHRLRCEARLRRTHPNRQVPPKSVAKKRSRRPVASDCRKALCMATSAVRSVKSLVFRQTSFSNYRMKCRALECDRHEDQY